MFKLVFEVEMSLKAALKAGLGATDSQPSDGNNNFNKVNYNLLNASLNVNNFVTSFEYLEERGDIGTKSYIKKQTRYSFDKNNSISFSTRENRELDMTEFYNLVYQYENDCLRAAIEYNKNFSRNKNKDNRSFF